MTAWEKQQLPDENDLLLRIAKGDEKAFTTLFRKYKDRIYSTSLRITESTVEAEEIVQDVFVKLWAKKQELPDIKNLEGYIYMMARNFTYNSLRRMIKARQNKDVAESSFPNALSEVAANVPLEEKELKLLLQNAIRRLPSQRQQVYQLIKNEELTKAQVAEKIGISPNTVKTHFDAAVRAIRAYVMSYIELFLLILWFY